ncbi:MAG: alpha/beta fold hydrolase [Bacteroidales bacterium]|nr:alpha/beta fold hydrolase [Bacteroidales bacterium]
MKKILVSFVFLLAAQFALSGASRIVVDSLRSNVLGATLKYSVYLPDGYGKTDCQYPVVYLLHGLFGTHTDWAERGTMRGVADELIASGEAVPMVIVMPNAGDPDVHHKQNGYFNMPGWNYEDFFFKEFVPEVEGKYRCISDKAHRAVMGLSMGGGGSAVYAQRHTDMFSSCYAMSAWLDQDIDSMSKPLDEADKLVIVSLSVAEHSAIKFVEEASEEVKEKLRSVKWFIDCGDDDYLLQLSEQLHSKMKEAGIKSELRVRNGGHNWEYWHTALRMALPFASRNFGK